MAIQEILLFDPEATYNEGDLVQSVEYREPITGDIWECEQDNVSGEWSEVEPMFAQRGGFTVGGLTNG